ncbi:DNA-directed RNA polymerase III subunit RPC2 [Astathelohania contejeani]|uniref:DNA-directed RNA polymerase subunit beta n=1 Tax=Astathelohania contejeani TaxID=164912 RepID=A0ABQ7HZ70_9MICR|nr:DNA-directed RNA polymerase III subunit RPC2 [Thelohania contejeani]
MYDHLVTNFITTKGLVRQHLQSFNYFITHEIRQILQANNIVDSDIDPNFYLKYTDIRVIKPTIEENMIEYPVYPHECRLRDFTYAGNIIVDLEYVRNKQIVIRKDVCIGKMPIMLRSVACHLNNKYNMHKDDANKEHTNKDFCISKNNNLLQECPLDAGGYFIVKGIERVILIQEQLSKNRIIVDLDAKSGLCASVTSSTHDTKSKTLVILKHGVACLRHNSLSEDIPVSVILKALGISSDKEIAELVGAEKEIQEAIAPTIEECVRLEIFTEERAVEYISKMVKGNSIEEVRNLLGGIILPNVRVEGLNYRIKGIYIALMTRRLLQAHLGLLSVDDRDFIGNKRYELAGQLLAILFEDVFKRFNTELKKSIDKVLARSARAQEFDAMSFITLQTNLITNTFVRAISTGNWAVKRFRMDRSGVTQVLSRLSYISSLGMMARINSQFEKTRKISGPRALHTSQWGMLCPSDTPEGESCGLVKNLALLSEITTDCPSNELLSLLYELGVEELINLRGSDLYVHGYNLVLLNGMIIGTIEEPEIFIIKFRNLRRKGKIHPFISISQSESQRTVNIASDTGRICRPLIIVEKGVPLVKEEDIRFIKEGYIDFDFLVRRGKIEYLDANEENDSNIALSIKDIVINTTHLEIAPYTILGTVAGLIPFPHHNQSPRNTYQCAMGKQAMGQIGYNQYNRMDTLLYVLTYAQKPLVRTKIIQLTNFEKLPAGHNAMVAVMSYSGYDIEDALILNRDSLDRGFGRCEIYRSYSTSLKRYANGTCDRIARGDDSFKMNILDSIGIAPPGERVMNGQALVNKQSPVSGGEFRFTGQVYHSTDPAMVDKVIVTRSGEDQLMIKTLLRQVRRPEIGDKFSSRHGQKGVVGLIVPQIDLPFTEDGISPDIIMNPHGFPSRMTVGKILELLSGKAAVLEGCLEDATAFCENKCEEISKALIKHGYSYSGKDILMDGISGKMFSAYIFFGPVYYQKLKHMVADKIHARARGPRAVLTRQPTEGRSRDGGLRFGEMERDCLIGYGASSLLIERLMISSDSFQGFICDFCGILAYKDSCNACGNSHPVPVKIPYACKLLFQELMSMNIKTKFKLK